MTPRYNTYWQQRIGNYCHADIQPRHVEAYMRLEHGTLDKLSAAQFRRSIIEAEQCVVADHNMAERLAQSYGI